MSTSVSNTTTEPTSTLASLADLRIQFGVWVWLSAPDADLHDAVHILPDELVVVQQLHRLSGPLRSVPLKRAEQRLPQVVQIVQVNGLNAAQSSARGEDERRVNTCLTE